MSSLEVVRMPSVPSGSYEWNYCNSENAARIKTKQLVSENFYPSGSSTEWRLRLKKDWNWTPNNNELVLSFFQIGKTNVRIDFVFLIMGRKYFFNVGDMLSEEHTVGRFMHKHLFPEAFKRFIFVRWSETGFAPSQHCTLLRDLGSLLNSGRFSDVVIETENGRSRIPAHWSILSSRSPVFRAMVGSGMLEARSKCIRIDDFPTKSVKDMLAFVYTGHMPPWNHDSDVDLLKLADKYQLEDLKKACGRHLSVNLRYDNAVQLLLLADTYQENYLKQEVLDFIAESPSLFRKLELFENLKQVPQILVDVITSLVRKMKESDK